MHADFSVELGRDDAALELPWSSADPAVRYYDLKKHPELLQQISEAMAHPELGAFLARINAAGFPLATAKCDAWASREVAPEEEVFGDRKFVSYIDLVFEDEAARCSFERHEAFAKDLCRLLSQAPEIPAAVEVVIRRCYYHGAGALAEVAGERLYVTAANERAGSSGLDGSVSGFCFTAYVTGFGDGDHEPRLRWQIALALLQNALVQLARG